MNVELSDWISAASLLVAGASAIYARRAYTASVELKKHDFILQLRTVRTTVNAIVADLPALLARAERSRRAIQAATGMRRSGVALQWEQRIGEWREEVQRFVQEQRADEELDSLSLEVLRDRIAEALEQQQRAAGLQATLEEELRRDDNERGELREDRRANRGTN